MIRGYSYGQRFDEANYLLKEQVLDEATLVRMLVGHRFDLAIGNPFAIKLQAESQGFGDRIEFIQPTVDKSPIYMAVSRKYPNVLKLASDLTGAIYELKQTSMYRTMLQRYAWSKCLRKQRMETQGGISVNRGFAAFSLTRPNSWRISDISPFSSNRSNHRFRSSAVTKPPSRASMVW